MKNCDAELHPAAQCVALRARRFSRLVTRHYDKALQGCGLTAAQFTLLGAVAIKQPISPIALARRLDLDKSTLSRNVRLLLTAKLLISEPRKEGGRALHITPRGRKTLRNAIPAWRKAQLEVTRLVGQDVVHKLDKMIAAMSQG